MLVKKQLTGDDGDLSPVIFTPAMQAMLQTVARQVNTQNDEQAVYDACCRLEDAIRGSNNGVVLLALTLMMHELMESAVRLVNEN
jgi:hypothetical protein